MMEVEPALSDFSSCDRTGRRNAVPDIKEEGDFSKVPATEGESSAMSCTPEGNEAGSVKAQAGEGSS
ncbi:hypothetical protein MATL_G00079920 [Megalops atlanticus]|uniref:cAMP-dependent protein kinase inhibitor gamma n=1 Tax=Megalops atlanticus TaxID=7932 RepID=A0A9D3Q6S6_MEGAT|nr:hypothetical protein MATL_G00079920 [Megalops atlanticus]